MAALLDRSAISLPFSDFVTHPKGEGSFEMYRFESIGNSLRYYIKISGKEGCFGSITMHVADVSQSIFIDYMEAGEKEKNIGRALHEFAVRFSFIQGYEGRVTLFALGKSDLFHINCGFRFETPLIGGKRNFLPSALDKFQSLFDELLEPRWESEWFKDSKNNMKQGYDEARKAAMKIFSEYIGSNTVESDAVKEKAEILAQKALGRVPKNNEELFDYGLHMNRNTLALEKIADSSSETEFLFLGSLMFLCDEVREQWKGTISNGWQEF